MKIMLFVCGEGLGHTSRCIALAQQMERSGHDVLVGAYGYSKELIDKKGLRTTIIPPEIQLVGDSGSLDLKCSIVATIKSKNFMGMRSVYQKMKEFGPDVVVSDSYYTGIIASFIRKTPVHLIVNQSNMEEFFVGKSMFMNIIGKSTKLFYSHIFKKVDGIIVPDYPMPKTVCRHNIDFDTKIQEAVFYSGPLIGKKYNDVAEADIKEPHVLSTVGGFGYRKPIFEKVIAAARLDKNINYTLLSGPSVDPDSFTDLPENVTILKFIDDQFPHLKSSDMVIAPGGHSMMMESLSFGIPIISFPDKDHSEQENNARALEADGCGKHLDYSVTAEELLDHIHRIMDNETYRHNTHHLRSYSHALNGPAAITRMLGSRYENE